MWKDRIKMEIMKENWNKMEEANAAPLPQQVFSQVVISEFLQNHLQPSQVLRRWSRLTWKTVENADGSFHLDYHQLE